MQRSSVTPNDLANTGVIIGDVVNNQSGGRRSSANARAVQLPSGAAYASEPPPVSLARPRAMGLTPTPCQRFSVVAPSPNHLLMSAANHACTYQDARTATAMPRGDHLSAAWYPASRKRATVALDPLIHTHRMLLESAMCKNRYAGLSANRSKLPPKATSLGSRGN